MPDPFGSQGIAHSCDGLGRPIPTVGYIVAAHEFVQPRRLVLPVLIREFQRMRANSMHPQPCGDRLESCWRDDENAIVTKHKFTMLSRECGADDYNVI